jgi:DNA-binding transcriptional ArsR family regulator
MAAFEVLGDPVRRRILVMLAERERSAGDVVEVIAGEFGLSQPSVSRHLRLLRENGFAEVRAVGTSRLYTLRPAGLEDAERWLSSLRGQWDRRLDALETEVARGRRGRAVKSKEGDEHEGPDRGTGPNPSLGG